MTTNYFGQHNDEMTLVPYSLWGQPGWFALPRGFVTRPRVGGGLEASPNSDFSRPLYEVKIGPDGTAVVQDLWVSRLLGQRTG